MVKYLRLNCSFILKMGDLCLFWNDILVSKHKINSKLTYEYYKKKSDLFIIDGMKKGANISYIKKQSLFFVQVFGNRRINKQKVSSRDHVFFLYSILFLIKIGIYDEDDFAHVFMKKNRLCKKKSNCVIE